MDEAQDLSPADLAVLRRVVTGSVILAEDQDQAIYKPGFTFRRANIDISGRTRILKTKKEAVYPLLILIVVLSPPIISGLRRSITLNGYATTILTQGATGKDGLTPFFSWAASFSTIWSAPLPGLSAAFLSG